MGRIALRVFLFPTSDASMAVLIALECSVHVLIITLKWLQVPPEGLRINHRQSILQNVSGGGMPPDPCSAGMLKHALYNIAKLQSPPKLKILYEPLKNTPNMFQMHAF